VLCGTVNSVLSTPIKIIVFLFTGLVQLSPQKPVEPYDIIFDYQKKRNSVTQILFI